MTGMRNKLRAVRGVSALTAVLAVVGLSCGGDDDDAAADSTTTTGQTTTTTVPSYDVEQARAAVDAVMDVPEGYTVTQRCLEPADAEREAVCRDDDGDVDEVMFGATNEAQAAIAVSALVFPDPDSAASRFAEWTADDDVYDGAFDVPPDDLGDGNSSPGRRGEGTIDDVEVGDWSGYRGLRAYDMVDGDGEVINHVTEAEVTLMRGNVLIQVLIDDVEGATRDAVGAAADDRAQRLVDGFG